MESKEVLKSVPLLSLSINVIIETAVYMTNYTKKILLHFCFILSVWQYNLLRGPLTGAILSCANKNKTLFKQKIGPFIGS